MYTILDTKKKVMDKEPQDFGPTRHYLCREPYFYEVGYTWDHLSGESPYEILHIAVKEDGSVGQ